MTDPAIKLKTLEKSHDFLIGIDSDGCVFDTMEVKHKECFIPNIINEWDLQAISKYAREAAEFVNLYSVSRGINRFPALVKVFDLLADRPEVKKRNFKLPNLDSLRSWIEEETKLANPALEEKVKGTGDLTLKRALKWSRAVNDSVEKIVRGVPPFPYVRESLERLSPLADMIVVSATPTDALEREWTEHKLKGLVKVIAGQEMGTKKECLAYAIFDRYQKERVLMIGDAPGDLRAAKENGILFYPINPGHEDISWQRFYEEAIDRLMQGSYKGAYEDKLIEEFKAYLPATPPWKA